MKLDHRPVVHTLPVGGFANQMIRTMAAFSIAERVENCRLSNIRLPDWGIDHPAVPSAGGLTAGYHHPRIMQLRVDTLVQNLRMGNIERVEISSYAQHLDNFLPVDFYRALFADSVQDVPVFERTQVVINIRGAEVLDARHPDYTLVPIEFYRYVVERTGLEPVFMGQLENNGYVARLKSAFPAARYVPSRGAMHDFALMRRAHNIIVSVSTFSWLAAYLSHASRIFVPLTGLYSPAQFPEIDLLPLDDPRYEYHLFPINYAVPVEEHESAHAAIRDRWVAASPSDIVRIRRTQPVVCLDKEKFFRKLDEDFYLRTYGDVREAVQSGAVKSALEHYVTQGFYQRRLPFRFDRVAYVRRYVEAAMAVANGGFAHPLHHFIEVGEAAGYTPF
jgi:hypothetical protein